MVATYVAARTLKVGKAYRYPGQPYPEGNSVHLIEHLLHTGFVKQLALTDAEFLDAVAQYCPEERVAVCAAAGVALPAPKPAVVRKSQLSKEIRDDQGR